MDMTGPGLTCVQEIRYARTVHAVARRIAGEMLIVPIRHSVGDLASIYSLNETGATIWSFLSIPRSKEEIVAELERRYHVTNAQAATDVEEFLRQMSSAGLVTEGSVAPSSPSSL